MAQRTLPVLLALFMVSFAPRLHALSVVQDSTQTLSGGQARVYFSVVNEDRPLVAGVRLRVASVDQGCRVSATTAPPGWTASVTSGNANFQAATASNYIYQGSIQREFAIVIRSGVYCCYNVDYLGAAGELLATRFTCLGVIPSDVGEPPVYPWSFVKSLYR